MGELKHHRVEITSAHVSSEGEAEHHVPSVTCGHQWVASGITCGQMGSPGIIRAGMLDRGCRVMLTWFADTQVKGERRGAGGGMETSGDTVRGQTRLQQHWARHPHTEPSQLWTICNLQ